MPSKNDTRRSSHLSSLTLTEAQAVGNSSPDLERRIRGTALGLSGTALVSKSMNDLRKLAGVPSGDA